MTGPADRATPGGPVPAGAPPERVAELLRTFSATSGRRRRRPRDQAPQTIVPLLELPPEGQTELDPGRIDAARARLREAALAKLAGDRPSVPAADLGAFDAAQARLRQSRRRTPPR